VSASLSQTNNRSANRSKVLTTLRGCVSKGITSNCEIAAEQAIELYKKGDRTLLKLLLDLGLKSDAHLSETLSIFYGEDLLSKSPRVFLRAIAARPVKQQRELSYMAGGMDGSGMTDKMLREVREKLRRIGKNKAEPLAAVARRCLSSVEAANKAAREN
jgi:hypothetical protein